MLHQELEREYIGCEDRGNLGNSRKMRTSWSANKDRCRVGPHVKPGAVYRGEGAARGRNTGPVGWLGPTRVRVHLLFDFTHERTSREICDSETTFWIDGGSHA